MNRAFQIAIDALKMLEIQFKWQIILLILVIMLNTERFDIGLFESSKIKKSGTKEKTAKVRKLFAQ